MDSNQNLQDFPNTTKPQSSEKGGIIQNSKNIRKDKNPKQWKKYLQDLKRGISQSKPKEESVYNLRKLFETPNNFPEKHSSLHTIKVELHNTPLFPEIYQTEEMEKFRNSNTKLQVFNGASNRQESIQPTSKQNIQDASNIVSVSDGDLLDCDRVVSSSPGFSNHSIKVEIYGLPKAQEANPEELLKSKSSNSVVLVDFRITNHKDSEIIVISDDEDDEDDEGDEDDERNIQPASTAAFKTEQNNVRNNSAQVSSESINNSLPKKVFKNMSAPNHEFTKSFSDFTAGCNIAKILKSPKNGVNSRLNTNISNLPKSEKPPHRNQLKSKSENGLTFQNKMDQTNNGVNYPNNNLKIYNTSSTQVDDSEDQFNIEMENDQNIHSESVQSLDIKSDAIGLNDNVKKDVLVSKDFTQNISDIAKNVMQSIQGVIYKTCCNSPSAENLCKNEIKTGESNISNSTSKHNMHFHIKLKVYNILTPPDAEKKASCDNKMDIQIEDFKLTESERNQAVNINNKIQALESKILKTKLSESEEKPAKQSNSPVQCSIYPKMTKRLTHVVGKKNSSSLRQSQLKLHQLKVQVEQRRLELLDLKLAREWEGIQRDIILFEKSLLPESYKIKPSHHDEDDVEI